MSRLLLFKIIEYSQNELASVLRLAFSETPINLNQYHSYLNMQYHLTKGVHRYFFDVAGWHKFSKQRDVRNFFCNFACEEELHYLLAAKDLDELRLLPMAEPVNVSLWHAYFEKITAIKPLERVGAACVLENISSGKARDFIKQALKAPFLNSSNTRFIVLHQHESVPHGDQLLNVVDKMSLEEQDWKDLIAGAKVGAILFLAMIREIFAPSVFNQILQSLENNHIDSLSRQELDAIKTFSVEDLVVSI